MGIGSPVNSPDIEGCTPLHLAAAYDHEGKCIEYLLNHRADSKMRDRRGSVKNTYFYLYLYN